VNQIDIQCSPSDQLQCSTHQCLLIKQSLVVVKERKENHNSRNAQRQTYRRIVIDDRITEPVDKKIKQDACSQDVTVTEPFLNINKILPDQRSERKKHEVVPSSHGKQSLDHFGQRNGLIDDTMINEVEEDGQCHEENITPPFPDAESDGGIYHIEIKQDISEPKTLLVMVTKEFQNGFSMNKNHKEDKRHQEQQVSFLTEKANDVSGVPCDITIKQHKTADKKEPRYHNLQQEFMNRHIEADDAQAIANMLVDDK